MSLGLVFDKIRGFHYSHSASKVGPCGLAAVLLNAAGPYHMAVSINLGSVLWCHKKSLPCYLGSVLGSLMFGNSHIQDEQTLPDRTHSLVLLSPCRGPSRHVLWHDETYLDVSLAWEGSRYPCFVTQTESLILRPPITTTHSRRQKVGT